MKKGDKVLVAMSGGIDSSVAMILLKKSGFSPIGITFKLIEGSKCCDIESQHHAKAVCKKYGIPHYIFDISRDFKKKVIDYFICELKNARTPNPCVVCNRKLKFDQLIKFAKKLGVKYVATGHYAVIKKDSNSMNSKYSLLKAKDSSKDQSYYLSFLPQKWLSKILFPVGKYNKKDIYDIAKKERLDFLVEKKQSQDLCFIEPKAKDIFIARNIKNIEGDIVDTAGNLIGKHSGLHHYTIGQRKGLNLSGGPYFVVGINKSKNTVIVSKNEKDPNLYTKEIKLKNINLISGNKIKSPIKVSAKIRYQQKASSAVLDGNVLRFSRPQKASTKGQVAVFYSGRKCLGGGIIK